MLVTSSKEFEVDAPDADAGRGDVENGAPEFFARRVERDEHYGAAGKWFEIVH